MFAYFRRKRNKQFFSFHPANKYLLKQKVRKRKLKSLSYFFTSKTKKQRDGRRGEEDKDRSGGRKRR